MEGSYCGYLKAHAGRGKTVYTEAFSHFCKIGGTGSCEGARAADTQAAGRALYVARCCRQPAVGCSRARPARSSSTLDTEA